MTPREMIAELKRRKIQLSSECAKAEALTIKEAKRLAVAYSSGPFSSAQLRKMGHPYARRAPNSRFPAVINVQTGQFRSNWHTGKANSPDMLKTWLINDDRVADFMKGTKLMVERPIIQAVQKLIEKDRIQNLERAIAKVSQ